jgi:hypothetical protein
VVATDRGGQRAAPHPRGGAAAGDIGPGFAQVGESVTGRYLNVPDGRCETCQGEGFVAAGPPATVARARGSKTAPYLARRLART